MLCFEDRGASDSFWILPQMNKICSFFKYSFALRADTTYRREGMKCSAQDLADHLGYTSSHLSILFRKKTGDNLSTYIKKRKIEEVKTLLRFTDKTLTNIASALGYCSLSHMSKTFKTMVGISPLQYRNQ